MNMDTSTPRSRTEISGGAHTPRKHDSAHKHVTGSADYIDDMPEPAGTLHGYLGLTTGRTPDHLDRSRCRFAPARAWWRC
jgi:xanthine dehydrogenase molybdopterin-binding subunit B